MLQLPLQPAGTRGHLLLSRAPSPRAAASPNLEQLRGPAANPFHSRLPVPPLRPSAPPGTVFKSPQGGSERGNHRAASQRWAGGDVRAGGHPRRLSPRPQPAPSRSPVSDSARRGAEPSANFCREPWRARAGPRAHSSARRQEARGFGGRRSGFWGLRSSCLAETVCR